MSKTKPVSKPPVTTTTYETLSESSKPQTKTNNQGSKSQSN